MRPGTSSSSSTMQPGQRPAGPFSPLFSGGGMWSSQGVIQQAQAGQNAGGLEASESVTLLGSWEGEA